ncbi:hypothetical protein [Parabacteroides sp. PF5-9]|uniref:hypothetical protein n=1 Tax=Parabacteroides sp. PF5-9 TaxID=1742404 RepID=UPI002476C499|nr:hypothetical protein [Parabacteroides sp. PF5-9]MDH6357785.1 hypothetical protein [Parabacteroides sp. PF5-9]
MIDKYLIICDERQQSYFSQQNENKDFRFILSEEGVENIIVDKIDTYQYIIIFAELLWQEKKYTDFYGIDVAVLLRSKLKALAPICILSFLPKNYFEKFSDIKYNILIARGTCFKQLPICFKDIENVLKTVLPISSAALAYLSTLLIDIPHVINVLRHDLRLETDIDKICSSLKMIEQLSTTNIYPKLQQLSQEIITTHYEENEDYFYSHAKDLITTLNIHLQNTKQDTLLTEKATKCKVLLLDDNSNDLNWAKNALSPYFEVIPFQDALAAKAYIEQDTKNELSAIICDWQLLKPNSKEHQELLGFEVLDFASQRGFYALFSLTSTDDFSIREIDALLDFEHLPITKDFQQGESLWKMYIPIIQQRIDRNLQLIASLPTGSRWETPKDKKTKSFHEQYVSIRNSNNWFSFENEIAANAIENWNYYKQFVNKRMKTSDQHLSISNTDLKNVLIARRIYLAYWFTCNYDNNGDKNKYIYQDLTGSSESSEERINQFVFRLCIKSELLPQGILPEEKAWLQSNKIDTDKWNK